MAQIFLDDEAFDYFINADELKQLLRVGAVSEREIDLDVIRSIPEISEDMKAGKPKSSAVFWCIYRGEFLSNRGFVVAALRQAIEEVWASVPRLTRAVNSPYLKRKRHQLLTPSRRVIRNGIDLIGPKFARHMSDNRIDTPERWQTEGCPKSYVLAYADKKWRARINNQKSQERKRRDMEVASNKQIASKSATPPTKHQTSLK